MLATTQAFADAKTRAILDSRALGGRIAPPEFTLKGVNWAIQHIEGMPYCGASTTALTPEQVASFLKPGVRIPDGATVVVQVVRTSARRGRMSVHMVFKLAATATPRYGRRARTRIFPRPTLQAVA